MNTKPAKPKTCKVCKTKFTPRLLMAVVCSPLCALEHSRAQTAKKAAKAVADERKATRNKLEAMRTKPQLLKVAQTAFNAFIRARDAGKSCICCDKPLGTEPNSFDAGHYRSVGSAPHMRFVEGNAHGQLKYCNQYLAGNVVAYRKGLIARIGLDAVEKIEADQTLRKYTKEELQGIAKHYSAEARKIKLGVSLA